MMEAEKTLIQYTIEDLSLVKSVEEAGEICRDYITSRSEDVPANLITFEKAIEKIAELSIYIEENPEMDLDTGVYSTPIRDNIEEILELLFY